VTAYAPNQLQLSTRDKGTAFAALQDGSRHNQHSYSICNSRPQQMQLLLQLDPGWCPEVMAVLMPTRHKAVMQSIAVP
jgi:hypothetical protein